MIEGLDNKTRAENQNRMLEDQYKYYSDRKLSRMVDQEQKITNSLQIEDTKKGNKVKISAGVDGVEKPKSDIQKDIEKCRQINEIGDCGLLAGTKCGFCLSSNRILYGDKNGPLEDTCNKDQWVAPGLVAPEQCTKMKEQDICSRVKDCGDTGGTKAICAWCPVKGKGMVWKRNNKGGKIPKYKDDKCDWPWDNNVNPKWLGWDADSRKDLLKDGEGDCNTDEDCGPGLKCGQRGRNKLHGVDKLNNKEPNKDFCYDPNKQSLHGSLIEMNQCKTFEENFPCMTPNFLTGPHNNACYQDLWKKSGCSGDVMERVTGSQEGKQTLEKWNKSSHIVVSDNMKSFQLQSRSADYNEANLGSLMCYGKEVDPCKSIFVNKNTKKSRPRACIDKMYKEGGCTKKGKIHPDNLKDWKNSKGGGIPDKWEENQNYGWSAYGYRGKIKEIRRNADKYKKLMGSGSNKKALADYADKAIYYNELCYGETPKVPTIESGEKPCWKDFKELMIISHPGVKLPDSDTLVFDKKDLGVKNKYMNDNNFLRRTLGKLGFIGQEWGPTKKVTKTMYEKEHFPYWKFYNNSREIYQKKPTWDNFRERVKKLPITGQNVMSDKIQFKETHRMALLFKQHNMPIESVNYSKNIKIGSSGSNTKSVKLPYSGMTVGSRPTNYQHRGWRDRFRTTVNGNYVTVRRLDQRTGWGQNLYLRATKKTAPFELTSAIWMKDDFPYHSFMKVLQNMEKKYL